MATKGSKYIRYSKIAGISSIPIIGIFVYLAMIGAIEVKNIDYTEHCAGTSSDPCLLYLDFTAKTDIFIEANDLWLETTPPIKSIKLYRSWGSGWREIDPTKPCNGAWCGCYWCSKYNTAKFAYVFRKDRDYQIKFEAMKYDPRDVIEWEINPKGEWAEAEAKEVCDYETVYWNTTKDHYMTVERCYNTSMQMNDSKEPYNITVEHCYNQTILNYTEIIEHSKQVCIKDTKRIEYAESKLEYEKENMCCVIVNSTHIGCDDGVGADGNGDCIYNSGETYYVFSLTNKIELDEVRNGDKIITSEYKTDLGVREK